LPDEELREGLRKVIQVGHAAADIKYAQLRSFRNAVAGGASILIIGLVAFGFYVYLHAREVPFCFRPREHLQVCPSGVVQPTSHDIILVGLLGILGGLLSAIVAVKRLHGTAIPYNVPVALALLKLPLGALSAIGALIVLRGNFVPGFSALNTQPQILAYAFGFGVAQQLLTGLVDRRAESLLAAAPGKHGHKRSSTDDEARR
jgi:hypothetical protein